MALKQIRLTYQPTGTLYNIDGLNKGDVLKVPEQVSQDEAARLCSLKQAEEVVEKTEEQATAKRGRSSK